MFKTTKRLVLASSSPRRRELLSACGLSFEIVKPDVDESVLDQEAPDLYVSRVAEEKARVISSQSKFKDAWVLAADTSVVLGDSILGKPNSPEHAVELLRQISGKTHKVYGGVSLQNSTADFTKNHVDISEVSIRDLSSEFISCYVASGEPMDKAGAYGIQEIGASFVTSISGSYSNVVGLNIAYVIDLLLSVGVIEFDK